MKFPEIFRNFLPPFFSRRMNFPLFFEFFKLRGEKKRREKRRKREARARRFSVWSSSEREEEEEEEEEEGDNAAACSKGSSRRETLREKPLPSYSFFEISEIQNFVLKKFRFWGLKVALFRLT